jgi:hypothetical protein
MTDIEDALNKLLATRRSLHLALARGNHEIVEQLRLDSYDCWMKVEQLRKEKHAA